MTEASPAAVPPFDDGHRTWTCTVVDAGSYEWRSDCGRLAVWRSGRAWRASACGMALPYDLPDCRAAMAAAAAALHRITATRSRAE